MVRLMSLISLLVLQGDTLAPFLFVIVLDYALRKAINGREHDPGFTIRPRRSLRDIRVEVTDLEFADDIALLSNDVEQAQSLLDAVEKECKATGLFLNDKKTKVLPVIQRSPNPSLQAVRRPVRDIKTYSISAIESSVCPRIKNLNSFTAAEKHMLLMYWSISSSSLVSIISISVSRRNPSQKASDLHFTTTERTPS